jgi:hypothetical protein
MTRTIAAFIGLTMFMQLAVLVQTNAKRLPVSSCEYQLAKFEVRMPHLKGTLP